jgi:hypothetical protein
LIRKYRFIKDSSKLGIPAEIASDFYDGFEEMVEVLKKYHFQWSNVSQEDWRILLDIEEKKQWPVFTALPAYFQDLYYNADENEKGNVELFTGSIRGEIILRENHNIKKNINEDEYILALKIATEQRFAFMLSIFEIDKQSFWDSIVKAAIATGITIRAVQYAYDELKKSKDEKT